MLSPRLVWCAALLALEVRAGTPYQYMAFKNLSDGAHPLPYYVDNRSAMPAGVDVTQVQAAADSAWSKWNAVSCAVPKAQGLGFTGATVPSPSDPYDAFNVTPIFVTSPSDDYYSLVFSYDLSAVTLPLQYAGVLQQCDIYLNGTNRQWSTTTPVPDGSLDVETVMLHEVGHCLGVAHNPDYPESVMTGMVLPGVERRELSATDVDILCQRYPLQGALGSPCEDAGCGDAGLTCVTQVIGEGPAIEFCTNGCDTGGDTQCDVPWVCQPATGFAPHDGACLRPGDAVTPIGKACSAATDCEAAIAACQPPTVASTGTPRWQDGYCTQSCAAGQPICPAGSECGEVDLDGSSTPACLQSCRIGLADCRPGYTCALPPGVTGGVCVPSCRTDADCVDAQTPSCRTCDGLCIEAGSARAPGDVCKADTDCGFGQQCLQLDPGSNVRLCSSACGGGCSSCPAGGSCQAIPSAGGELYCVRACAGPGTCPAGLQCAYLPDGRGCTPPCVNDIQCPVGTFCVGGECTIPADSQDSGASADGGPATGSGHSGCGCSLQGACWPLLTALALVRRVRRRASVTAGKRL